MTVLVAEAGLAGLLLITTFWCVSLDRRLRRLRVERSELHEFLSLMNTASERAEAALTGLREAVGDAERAAGRSDEAARRAAELTRLIEAGGRLLRRLEPAVHRTARAAAELSTGQRDLHPAPPREPPAGTRDHATVGRADQEALRRALETLR